jgi:hypothetical protein
MHSEFWWGNVEEIDSVENLGADGRVILKFVLKY